MNHHTTLAASISYNGAANAFAFGAGIIRQKVFAIVLSPNGLGAFGLAASFLELMISLERLGAPIGLLQEFSRSLRDGYVGRAARVFLDMRRLVLSSAFTLGLGVTLLTPWIVLFLFGGALPWWTVIVLAVAAPLTLVAELCTTVINAMGQIRTLAVCNLTTTGLALLMTVWLVSTFGLAGAIFQVLSGALVALVVSGGFLYSMFRPSEHSPRLVGRDDARGAVVSALRVGLAQTMHWAVAAGNLFIFRSVIVASLGVHSNGLYQGTMSLSRQYTSALLSGIFVYLYPHLARTAGRSEVFARELTKAVGFGVALVVPISLMLSSTRDWIVQGIFTSAFAPMTHLMVYSLPGDAAEVLVGILRIALLACGPVRSYLVVGLMEQALYLGVFLGAVRLFGLTGAAGAYLVSGIAGSLMYGFALARRGEILLTPRFVWQVLLAGPVVGMVSMSALGVTSSRAFALALALLWIVAYRRELLSGLRN